MQQFAFSREKEKYTPFGGSNFGRLSALGTDSGQILSLNYFRFFFKELKRKRKGTYSKSCLFKAPINECFLEPLVCLELNF